MDYETNKWYNIKVIIDVANEKFSAYSAYRAYVDRQ